jgi:antitoxin VapB
MDTAKVFWSGRSQAVRLPQEFRIDAKEVRIRRHGQAIILEPIATDWSAIRNTVVGPVDEDFERAVLEQPAPQIGPALDFE